MSSVVSHKLLAQKYKCCLSRKLERTNKSLTIFSSCQAIRSCSYKLIVTTFCLAWFEIKWVLALSIITKHFRQWIVRQELNAMPETVKQAMRGLGVVLDAALSWSWKPCRLLVPSRSYREQFYFILLSMPLISIFKRSREPSSILQSHVRHQHRFFSVN